VNSYWHICSPGACLSRWVIQKEQNPRYTHIWRAEIKTVGQSRQNGLTSWITGRRSSRTRGFIEPGWPPRTQVRSAESDGTLISEVTGKPWSRHACKPPASWTPFSRNASATGTRELNRRDLESEAGSYQNRK